jgi:phosphoenolpyruvate carboxylase
MTVPTEERDQTGSPKESDESLRERGLVSLDEEVKEAIEGLRDVLQSSGQNHLAALLPWLEDSRETAKLAEAGDIAEVYSIAFQLLDMVEEQVGFEFRRDREALLGPETEKGLWPRCLRALKKEGFSEEEIAEAMGHIRIEPVFTAHPTEAKRASVRERHRDL